MSRNRIFRRPFFCCFPLCCPTSTTPPPQSPPVRFGRIHVIHTLSSGRLLVYGPHWYFSVIMFVIMLTLGVGFVCWICPNINNNAAYYATTSSSSSSGIGGANWYHYALGITCTAVSSTAFVVCVVLDPGIVRPGVVGDKEKKYKLAGTDEDEDVVVERRREGIRIFGKQRFREHPTTTQQQRHDQERRQKGLIELVQSASISRDDISSYSNNKITAGDHITRGGRITDNNHATISVSDSDDSSSSCHYHNHHSSSRTSSLTYSSVSSSSGSSNEGSSSNVSDSGATDDSSIASSGIPDEEPTTTDVGRHSTTTVGRAGGLVEHSNCRGGASSSDVLATSSSSSVKLFTTQSYHSYPPLGVYQQNEEDDDVTMGDLLYWPVTSSTTIAAPNNKTQTTHNTSNSSTSTTTNSSTTSNSSSSSHLSTVGALIDKSSLPAISLIHHNNKPHRSSNKSTAYNNKPISSSSPAYVTSNEHPHADSCGGVYHSPVDNLSEPRVPSSMYFCDDCGYFAPAGSYHCEECEVCIEGYDHHCPWTSKCIGRGNAVVFYIWIFTSMLSLLYMALATGLMSTTALSAAAHSGVRGHHHHSSTGG
eukprot:GHVS01018820.1.p1 GENE.GHVS01018820.1~~GHVS01018820.1.p1  ORF type:complete len:592 (-),score=135.27 GHVS01018820.1:166-1941(-)